MKRFQRSIVSADVRGEGVSDEPKKGPRRRLNTMLLFTVFHHGSIWAVKHVFCIQTLLDFTQLILRTTIEHILKKTFIKCTLSKV